MDVLLIPLIELIKTLVGLYVYVVIIYVSLLWLINIGVLDSHNHLMTSLIVMLRQLCEPLLAKIRAFVPRIAGFDISPMILILGLNFIIGIINRLLIKLYGVL